MKKFSIKSFVILLLIVPMFFCGCDLSLSSFNNTTTAPKKQANLTSSKLIDASSSTTQEELLASVFPAVVGIVAVSGNYQSIGTGVCIDSKSYILTNNHVIDSASVISLYLSNGTTCSASLVWKDSGYDLAVLQASKEIPYLKMVESGNYSAGEEVIAIGTPIALAFKHSATKGIISATNRTIAVDNDFGQTTLDNMIQHDASINPGNSGGPLINMKGEVVGINTVKVSDAEAMGFAIPVDTIKPLVTNLSANGFYNTAYMGVFGYDAHLNKIGNNKVGYYIQDVAKNSPAECCDFQKGDIILKVDGEKIDSSITLRKLLYTHQAGEVIEIEFERNGKIMTTTIKLEEHPCCYKSLVIPQYYTT